MKLLLENPQAGDQYVVVPNNLREMPAGNIPGFVSLVKVVARNATMVYVQGGMITGLAVKRGDGSIVDRPYRVIPVVPADGTILALYQELLDAKAGKQHPSPRRLGEIKEKLGAILTRMDAAIAVASGTGEKGAAA